jgi:hypothetical protein
MEGSKSSSRSGSSRSSSSKSSSKSSTSSTASGSSNAAAKRMAERVLSDFNENRIGVDRAVSSVLNILAGNTKVEDHYPSEAQG